MKYVINTFRLLCIIIISAYSSITGILILVFTFSSDRCVNTAVKLFSRSLFFISRVKYTSYGGDLIERNPAKIYVSNHESHYDPPAIALGSPGPLYFLAKKELKYIPFIGWYIWASGMIFIDRKNRRKAQESLIVAGEKIKNGKNIISFAEGTRSKTGELMIFRKGSFRLARMHDIDIVPVGILGTRNVLPSGGWFITPGEVKVNYGTPMKCTDYNHLSLEEFANECRTKVAELIEELKQK